MSMRSGRKILAPGFSLIEIAVVLLIISVLISIVAIPIATQMDQSRVAETNKQLEAIKEALIGYALANGRLPCPAIDGITFGSPSASSSGAEAPAPGGGCKVRVGYVPAATIGISPVDSYGFALDAWGTSKNRIIYGVANIANAAGSVCPSGGVVFPLTTPSGIKSASMDCISNQGTLVPSKLISVCSAAPSGGVCGGTTLTSSAPFVLVSLGKNAPTGGVVGDETHNIDQDLFFVSHTPTAAGSPAGEFDDIVVWPSLNTLFARMVQAGKLP